LAIIMTTVTWHASSLNEQIWLQILIQIPDATGYWKASLPYDPVVTIGKFGLASRCCQHIVQHCLIASKVQSFIEKRRLQDRSNRAVQRCNDPRIVQLCMDGNMAAVEAELLRGVSLNLVLDGLKLRRSTFMRSRGLGTKTRLCLWLVAKGIQP